MGDASPMGNAGLMDDEDWTGGVRWRCQRMALRVFARLPTAARRGVVRVVSPSFTAGAIVVIERADGAILLIRQSYRHGWGLPGGLLAKGESPSEGAQREVWEEVGLRVDPIEPATLVMDVTPRRLDFVYRASLNDGGDVTAPVRPRSPELDAAEWFSLDALPRLQKETRNALDALGRPDVLPFLADRHGPAGPIA